MWSVNFFRRNSHRLVAVSATLVAFAASPTHSSSAEALDAPAIRWHETDALPLQVWVQPALTTAPSRIPFSDNVRAAFTAWSSVTAIEFHFSSDSASADVRVYASEGTLLSSQGRVVSALTHCEVDDRSRIVRAEVVIAMRRANGRTLSTDALTALAMHEAGHVLGLEHSRDSQSIMFPMVQVNALSAGDVASVRALYPASATRAEVLGR